MLVTGGVRRGRELRRRRTTLASVGAGAAVAVLAAGVATVPQLVQGSGPLPVAPAGSGGSDRGVDPLPTPTVVEQTEIVEATPTPAATSESPDPGTPDASPRWPLPTETTGGPASPDTSETPATDPATDPGAAQRDLAVSAPEVPGAFTGIVGGSTSDVEAYPEVNAALAHFRWDGFATTVMIEPSPQGTPEALCRRYSAEGASCSDGADGAVYSTWQETGPEADGGVTGRGISWWTADGWAVDVISYNAAEGKDSEVLADEPPLSAAELAEVASSGVWFD